MEQAQQQLEFTFKLNIVKRDDDRDDDGSLYHLGRKGSDDPYRSSTSPK